MAELVSCLRARSDVTFSQGRSETDLRDATKARISDDEANVVSEEHLLVMNILHRCVYSNTLNRVCVVRSNHLTLHNLKRLSVVSKKTILLGNGRWGSF